MRHHHLCDAVELLEFDSDLRCGRMPVAHTHLRRKYNVAVLVGYELGIDEEPVCDHLDVLTGEPHRPRARRGLDLHANQTASADAHVHPGDWDAGTGRPVPLLEVLRVSPHLPDELGWRVEAALDHHRILGTLRFSHPACQPPVAARVA